MSLLPPNTLDFIVHPRRYPTRLSYFNGFSYGLGISMLMLLVPLYVLDLGFSLADLGLIVSAAAIFMVVLRLAGGAVADRFGERIVLWFSFASLIGCALVFVVSENLLPLIFAQLLNGISRSVYWSAGQSYTSRSAEGNAGLTMGRLLSFESAGGLLGAVIAGGTAEFAGFDAAFLAAAGVNALGVVNTAMMPALPRKDQVRSIRASLTPARRLLVQRSMGLGHYTAFMSAGYAALTGSLFAALFKDAGYGDTMIGVLRSANGIGVILVAYPFGALLAAWGVRNVAAAGLAATGAVTMLIAFAAETPVLPFLLMVLGGLSFGALRSLYPAVASANSSQQERGLALSVVGLYWAVSMLIVPYAFGLIADAIGVAGALYVFGGVSIAAAAVTPLLARLWRDRDMVGAPAEAGGA